MSLFPLDPLDSTSRYISKGNEISILMRQLHLQIHCRTITAETCKQQKGPLMNDWIKKM